MTGFPWHHAAPWVVAFLIIERLLELWLARQHTRALLAQGGREVGESHYPLVVLLHGGFLLSLIVETTWGSALPPSWWFLPAAAAIGAEALRLWCIITLGERWTTRVIVLADDDLKAMGPYRWLDHPNYLAVSVELAAIPLALGAYWTAVVFGLLNLWFLYRVRIPLENEALGRTGS